jgi:hypothetical protein
MAENIEMSNQVLFLQKIKSALPAAISLADELADILGVSSDSAYRRIRGTTALTLEEVITLSTHFKISLDSFLNFSTGMVTFNYAVIDNKIESFKGFLEKQRDDLKKIVATENSHITYACEDIPVFHNYRYPKLASFKIFYWLKSIMNVEELEGQKFSQELIPQELKDIGENIYKLYSQVPSTEIWTDTTIQSTIKQIEFYWESGIFETKESALEVCEELKKELTDIEKQASLGKKTGNGKDLGREISDYQLYFSEIEMTNNCVLVKLNELKVVYLSHQTFNTISTSNNKYCEETEVWLNNIMRKSNLISGISEKLRYQFFKKAYKVLEELEGRIRED